MGGKTLLSVESCINSWIIDFTKQWSTSKIFLNLSLCLSFCSLSNCSKFEQKKWCDVILCDWGMLFLLSFAYDNYIEKCEYFVRHNQKQLTFSKISRRQIICLLSILESGRVAIWTKFFVAVGVLPVVLLPLSFNGLY